MVISVALLRGVNVGGRTVKMDRLRALCEGLGLGAVSTYIQSGNVLFDGGEEPPEALAARLEGALRREFGFDIPAMVLPAGELADIAAACPYRETGNGRAYVTLLAAAPSPESAARLRIHPASADEFKLIGRAVYVLCRGGYHETPYSNGWFEKQLKIKATTRNLDVLEKLVELASRAAMKVKPMHPIDHINRYVASIEDSVAFYTGALGYTVLGRGTKANGKLYAILAGSGHELFLSEKEYYRPESEHNLRHIGYGVDDADGLLAELKAKGYASEEQEIIVKQYSRQFYIKDPDGLEIDCIQWTDKAGFYRDRA